MIQNTSETRESLMEYTIPQLESMVEAITENNKTENSTSGTKDILEDKEALKYLINSGGKL
jgi:hypothetical protein